MTLRAKIDVWQKDLIDMSRNNNLLYYRSSGRGAGIAFQVDNPDRLFHRVAYTQRPLPLDELRSDLEAEDLDARLSRLRARARDDLNDRGINTLFLAFGMLEWRESEHSDEIIRSPLVLAPVTLGRQGVLGPFQIQRLDDEEIEINPTLREKLLHDFKNSASDSL